MFPSLIFFNSLHNDSSANVEKYKQMFMLYSLKNYMIFIKSNLEQSIMTLLQ